MDTTADTVVVNEFDEIVPATELSFNDAERNRLQRELNQIPAIAALTLAASKVA